MSRDPPGSNQQHLGNAVVTIQLDIPLVQEMLF